MSNFIEKCLSGEALLEDVDDYVDDWHSSTSSLSLHEYLGMKKSEYSLWVADPEVLTYIVIARREDKDVGEIIDNMKILPIAARAENLVKARQLMQWLRNEGLWE